MNVLTAAIAAEGASTMKTITSQRKTASTPNTTRQEQKPKTKRKAAPQTPRVTPTKAKPGKNATPAAVRAKQPKAALVEPPAESGLEFASSVDGQVATEQPALHPEKEPAAEVGQKMPEVAAVPVRQPGKREPRVKKATANPKTSAEPKATREGSKTAQVVTMLQREGGATLAEIMLKMGWQKHTVRGFMAGAMKKAGYAVESFKPEGGERTYRIGN